MCETVGATVALMLYSTNNKTLIVMFLRQKVSAYSEQAPPPNMKPSLPPSLIVLIFKLDRTELTPRRSLPSLSSKNVFFISKRK